MLRVAAGDATAFRQLVARHEGSLRRFCSSIVRDVQTARELAQDVMLRVWRDREAYDPRGRFRAYLFTIARNHCRSWNRRARFMTLVGLDPTRGTASTAPLGDEMISRNESIAIVGAAVARLPEKFRTPLLLRFSEGLPYEEIALVIGRTPSAARSRVHYGLKALAELLPEEVLE